MLRAHLAPPPPPEPADRLLDDGFRRPAGRRQDVGRSGLSKPGGLCTGLALAAWLATLGGRRIHAAKDVDAPRAGRGTARRVTRWA